MPIHKGYPKKTRSVAVGMSFPGKSRDISVDNVSGMSMVASGTSDSGKMPKKGVLMRGGGHG